MRAGITVFFQLIHVASGPEVDGLSSRKSAKNYPLPLLKREEQDGVNTTHFFNAVHTYIRFWQHKVGLNKQDDLIQWDHLWYTSAWIRLYDSINMYVTSFH